MSKIENPVVLIHKRENSDSYAVAITNGSHGYSDAVLMASMDLGMHGNDIDTWSKTGYYMAAEIEKLRDCLKQAEENYLRAIGETDSLEVKKQRLTLAAKRIIRWNRQEAADRTGNAEDAESYACFRELRDALAFCESSRSFSAGATENCRSSENVQVLQEQSGTTHGLYTVQSGVEVAVVPSDDVGGKPVVYVSEETLACAEQGELLLRVLSQPSGDAIIPLYRHAQPAQEYPETLPCPVILEPGFRFGKGVSTHLVLRALKNRTERYAELDAMGSEARAEHDAAIAELREKLGFGAPAKTAVQIKLPGLPKLGSNAEWYQGFAAGAGSMREACAAALVSAGVEITGEEK